MDIRIEWAVIERQIQIEGTFWSSVSYYLSKTHESTLQIKIYAACTSSDQYSHLILSISGNELNIETYEV